jgi:hypothetical protein
LFSRIAQGVTAPDQDDLFVVVDRHRSASTLAHADHRKDAVAIDFGARDLTQVRASGFANRVLPCVLRKCRRMRFTADGRSYGVARVSTRSAPKSIELMSFNRAQAPMRELLSTIAALDTVGGRSAPGEKISPIPAP